MKKKRITFTILLAQYSLLTTIYTLFFRLFTAQSKEGDIILQYKKTSIERNAKCRYLKKVNKK
jgi:hypothetical protein